jgi:hypothetical protein
MCSQLAQFVPEQRFRFRPVETKRARLLPHFETDTGSGHFTNSPNVHFQT